MYNDEKLPLSERRNSKLYLILIISVFGPLGGDDNNVLQRRKPLSDWQLLLLSHSSKEIWVEPMFLGGTGTACSIRGGQGSNGLDKRGCK